ncbi:MAG TPA: cytochrome P450 [Pyrinomonadaceae bacterium]|nr:cytochrome P450 [Pyrinomonadaceae bacterium]
MVATANRLSASGAPQAPGPRGHFLFGNGRDVTLNPTGFYMRMRREYGDVVRMRGLPGFYWYLVAHPEGVERVLQTNQQNYPKGPHFNKPLSLLVGRGLLTSEGEFWRRQRRLAQPAFHRQRVAALGGTMTSATLRMLERWRGLQREGCTFDVAAEMTRLTLQIAGLTLFGVDLGGDAGDVGGALRVAFEHLNYRMIYPWALPEVVPTRRNRRFLRARRALDGVVYRVIRERRRRGEDTGDLFSMLLLARDEETGEGMSDEQLRDEVMTILIAGHETGAAALAWAWYMLARHPKVERKLCEELARVLGGRTPTVEDLPALPYTRMFFDEVLRLYPPAWGLPRQARGEDEIGGRRIPAGSLVVVSQYVTHRHPDFWDEPERFDPERFAPASAAPRPKYAYFPFGGGSRQCIGNSFALMEAQLVLATVAQHFRPRLAAGQEVEEDPTFTLRPRGGVRVTLG